MESQHKHHIVIVGGGAGGLELAACLGKKLGKRNRAQITLVDANLTHLWKPLLHEVAAGTLNSHEDQLDYIAYAANYHFTFALGKLNGLNRREKIIYLAPIADENNNEIIPARSLSYDTLVIAIGSTVNDFSTPGVYEHCLFLNDHNEANQFHQLFLRKMLQAQSQPNIAKQLRIAIVGGGATGVELAAELYYAIHQVVYYGWEHIDPEQNIQITLIEAADRILSALPERLASATAEQLKKMGVEIYTRQRVSKVTAEGLHTNDGLFVSADLKVWAAGIKAADFLQNLDGLETNHLNQLIVKQTLQTTVDDNIFAFGDCASCPQPGRSNPVPPRAQAAHQQASLLVKSLQRRLKNKSLLPYYYRDYGSLISLSRYDAVGNLMGRFMGSIFIEGKLARLFYISLYKMHQIALYGFWRVGLLTFANFLTRRLRPRLKLH